MAVDNNMNPVHTEPERMSTPTTLLQQRLTDPPPQLWRNIDNSTSITESHMPHNLGQQSSSVVDNPTTIQPIPTFACTRVEWTSVTGTALPTAVHIPMNSPPPPPDAYYDKEWHDGYWSEKEVLNSEDEERAAQKACNKSIRAERRERQAAQCAKARRNPPPPTVLPPWGQPEQVRPSSY